MKFEFHAQYPLATQDSVTQGKAIDWLAGESDRLPPAWRELPPVEDEEARLSLLAQAVATANKEQARMGAGRKAGGFGYWLEQRAEAFLKDRHGFLEQLNLTPTPPDITTLPAGAWAIHFPFVLSKPYLSRDDTDFHILDNPVKKEHVFAVPYVAPSQWKGALRAAMIQETVAPLRGNTIDERRFTERRLRLYRLFGSEPDGVAGYMNRALALHRAGLRPETAGERERAAWEERVEAETEQVAQTFEGLLRERGYRIGDVEGFRGRLRCYPTYFDDIGLTVINPHERDTGAGKQPIYFECVPAGARGTFTLLYVPLDRAGADDSETRRQATADLRLAAAGVYATMTLYGFGAKTSSGFGVTYSNFPPTEEHERSGRLRFKEPDGRVRRFGTQRFEEFGIVARRLWNEANLQKEDPAAWD